MVTTLLSHGKHYGNNGLEAITSEDPATTGLYLTRHRAMRPFTGKFNFPIVHRRHSLSVMEMEDSFCKTGDIVHSIETVYLKFFKQSSSIIAGPPFIFSSEGWKMKCNVPLKLRVSARYLAALMPSRSVHHVHRGEIPSYRLL